jgi:hypothetical protein
MIVSYLTKLIGLAVIMTTVNLISRLLQFDPVLFTVGSSINVS